MENKETLKKEVVRTTSFCELLYKHLAVRAYKFTIINIFLFILVLFNAELIRDLFYEGNEYILTLFDRLNIALYAMLLVFLSQFLDVFWITLRKIMLVYNKSK